MCCGWTKKKTLLLLGSIVLMSALTGVCINILVCFSPAQEQAAPAFAQDAMTFTMEMAQAEEVMGEAIPTQDNRLFRMEVVRETPPPESESLRVLIYHSHTWEAFTQVEHDRYTETEKWRTRDNAYNVVAVGEALASQLRAHGIHVVHDTTAFEPPDFEQAYVRSLAMLEDRITHGETYDLYIDLHRDAIASNSTLKRTVNIGGVDTARFMMLIGKGTGSGFDVKPDWEANLDIAQRITDSLNAMADSLCRDVKIKTGRFNQHVAPRCVLIECGNNLNTLEEVLAGIPYLAEAIADTLTEVQ